MQESRRGASQLKKPKSSTEVKIKSAKNQFILEGAYFDIGSCLALYWKNMLTNSSTAQLLIQALESGGLAKGLIWEKTSKNYKSNKTEVICADLLDFNFDLDLDFF